MGVKDYSSKDSFKGAIGFYNRVPLKGFYQGFGVSGLWALRFAGFRFLWLLYTLNP